MLVEATLAEAIAFKENVPVVKTIQQVQALVPSLEV